MSNGPWTDEENELIVADYFAMLAADVAGQPYNKAEHNRDLQARIDRNQGAQHIIASGVTNRACCGH